MNPQLKNVFKQCIKCYEGIEALAFNHIFDEEEKAVHEHNLLHNIIEVMKTEVAEQEIQNEEKRPTIYDEIGELLG